MKCGDGAQGEGRCGRFRRTPARTRSRRPNNYSTGIRTSSGGTAIRSAQRCPSWVGDGWTFYQVPWKQWAKGSVINYASYATYSPSPAGFMLRVRS
jgi:hypothetical protein